MVTKALKLPGLDPGRQYKTIRATEAELVRQWIQWGGLHNCTILQIGQGVHYLSCPSCKGRKRKILCPMCHDTNCYSIFSQNTTGAPDTFWTHLDRNSGLLVLDDSTLDKPHARHMALVHKHWSGKHH